MDTQTETAEARVIRHAHALVNIIATNSLEGFSELLTADSGEKIAPYVSPVFDYIRDNEVHLNEIGAVFRRTAQSLAQLSKGVEDTIEELETQAVSKFYEKPFTELTLVDILNKLKD